MSLYKDASLVMIPTAYKDGKLYSVRPVEQLGSELVTNGDFSSASDWTFSGSGVAISGGKLNFTGTTREATQSISVVNTKTYRVSYEVSNFSAGSVRAEIGSSIGIERTANGIYSEYIVASGANTIEIDAVSFFTGSIDNVSVKEVLVANGDFTFSRGSNLAATRVDVNGLIEKGRENLLTYSNTFNTGWSPTAGTFTQGVTDPFGGNAAWSWTASNTDPYIYNLTSGSGVYTLSIWAKGVGSTIGKDFEFRIGGAVQSFTLTSDWQRFELYVNGSFANIGFEVGNPAVAGDVVHIYGAQLEQGLVATDYIETGASTAQAGILEDMPRLDYSGGASCPSLLLEPQRTNLLENSEYILGGDWNALGGALTIEQNTTETLSPEGQYNAGKITLSSTANRYFSSQGYNLGGLNNISGSVWLKSDGADIEGVLAFFNGSGGDAITITNEWQRFEINKTASNSTEYIGLDFRGGGYSTSGVVYCYGWQFENNSSYPTSYIPTYGTSQTRARDQAYKTGVSSLIGQTEGTLFVDFDLLRLDGFSGIIDINTALTTTMTRVLLWETGGTSLSANFGTKAPAINLNNPTIGRHKVVIIYSASICKLFVDGVKIGESSTSGSFSGLDVVSYVCAGGGVNFQKKNIHQTLLFPTALTDSECIALTTL